MEGDKLHQIRSTSFEVQFADWKVLYCQGMSPKVKLSMQDQEIKIDLFLLPLKNYVVVSGFEWLRTLGDAYWNFFKFEY